MFRTVTCPLKQCRQCLACDYPAGCPAGSYESVPCTPRTNRQCKQCMQICPYNDWQYMSGRCNATSNAVCSNCSTYEQKGCASPLYETYLIKCGDMTDSQCGKCDPLCEDGKTYETRPCSNSSNRQCMPCTKCLGNAYTFRECTQKLDAKCLPCDNRACRDDEYESKPCNITDADNLHTHECSKCSPRCDPLNFTNPTYEAVPCSGSSNRTAGTNRLCLPCTRVCPAGQVLPSAIVTYLSSRLVLLPSPNKNTHLLLQTNQVMVSYCTDTLDSKCVEYSLVSPEDLSALLQQIVCPWGTCSAQMPPATAPCKWISCTRTRTHIRQQLPCYSRTAWHVNKKDNRLHCHLVYSGIYAQMQVPPCKGG